MTSICTMQRSGGEDGFFFLGGVSAIEWLLLWMKWPRNKAQSPNQEYTNKYEGSTGTATIMLTTQNRARMALGKGTCPVKNMSIDRTFIFSLFSCMLEHFKNKMLVQRGCPRSCSKHFPGQLEGPGRGKNAAACITFSGEIPDQVLVSLKMKLSTHREGTYYVFSDPKERALCPGC